MWTDININFQRRTLQHCCKQIHTPISYEDLDSLEHNVFEKHHINLRDRKISIEENKLPPTCKWCIDTAPNNIKKVWNIWDDNTIDEIKPLLMDVSYVGYIDLDIGKSCDLACIYCGPWSSTTWAKELNQPTTSVIDPIWKEKTLKHLSTFLKNVDNSNKLVFNILGGEPLLIVDTYDIISYLAESCDHFTYKPQMMITTNLNCKPALLQKLLDTIEKTKDAFEWVISVSIEDIHERAEAVRYHIEFDRFEHNLKIIKDKVEKIYLTTTFSLMSFPNYDEFINWSFDILGENEYTNKWDYSLNNVQEGYTDLAYCPKQYINIERIKQTFINRSLHCKNEMKKKQVINHLENMYARAGSKEIDTKFIGWWQDISSRRNVSYDKFHPLDKLLK